MDFCWLIGKMIDYELVELDIGCGFGCCLEKWEKSWEIGRRVGRKVDEQ